MFIPRPRQQEVLAYRGGTLGIAAVPGSGKTQVLSALAAGLIASGELAEDQEILIVTLVNAAVDNFAGRIEAGLGEAGLSPRLGYRVRTLHGLAHDILRERPERAGLATDFQILDERAADRLRQSAVVAWLKANPQALSNYFDPDLSQEQLRRLRRQALPELADEIAQSWISAAKDAAFEPAELQARLVASHAQLPLAELGVQVYAAYQRALAARNALDFDDLVRLALLVLQRDARYLASLRRRWPYILEDEAQDSSRLQEQILRLLAGPGGNWVRVGDPNQAIYETFTTASPQYLRDFLSEAQVARQLPNSGRSSPAIIALANRLIDWSRFEHPIKEVRTALSPPHIEPVPVGDPQPNPPDSAGRVIFYDRPLSPAEELRVVADSLARWLPEHPEATVAALVPSNGRGFELVSELRRRKIEPVELLRSTSATRQTAGALETVIQSLADPQSAGRLASAYRVWRRSLLEATASAGGERPAMSDPRQAAGLLRQCRRVEEFVWPAAGRDYLDSLLNTPAEAHLRADLERFRQAMQRWQGMALLPASQLVLALAQELFHDPVELATAHKLAAVLEGVFLALPTPAGPNTGALEAISRQLGTIARNERRFIGFSEEDTGFDPRQHGGQVVVATVHKAKGLEWERVYLLSVNNYDYPSGRAGERSAAEHRYLRDRLNMPAEALAQLQALLPPQAPSARGWQSARAVLETSAGYAASESHEVSAAEEAPPSQAYIEGLATRQGRLDYAAERLRLLYVGITRARNDLIITWNSGASGELQPALSLRALFPRPPEAVID